MSVKLIIKFLSKLIFISILFISSNVNKGDFQIWNSGPYKTLLVHLKQIIIHERIIILEDDTQKLRINFVEIINFYSTPLRNFKRKSETLTESRYKSH